LLKILVKPASWKFNRLSSSTRVTDINEKKIIDAGLLYSHHSNGDEIT
jgi:hypothetical protein